MKINWHWPHVEPRVGDVFPRGWDWLPWYVMAWRAPWWLLLQPLRVLFALVVGAAYLSVQEGRRAWDQTA